MNSDLNANKQQLEQELQQDILRGRKFTLADMIAQEGGGFLKGESPVPRFKQLKAEIKVFVRNNLSDSSGALQAVLNNWIEENDVGVSKYQDNPLLALAEMLETIVSQSDLFYEFVRQVDLKWGQMYQERPFFQQPGQTPHPDDEYSHESVKAQLLKLQEQIIVVSNKNDT
jgi:hypothetical protein